MYRVFGLKTSHCVRSSSVSAGNEVFPSSMEKKLRLVQDV